MSLLSIRLPHVYGARDLLFARLARGRGLMAVPGRGSNRFSHLHIEDAARALVAATTAEVEGAWPIADREPTTWSDFFAVLRDHYPRCRIIALPAWAATTGAMLLRPVLRLRRRPSLIATGTVTGWNLNLEVAPDSLWSELGLKPLYPTIATGIPAALDDCVAFRWIHPVEDRVDW